MSSITYAGHAFGDHVSAELVEPVSHTVAPEMVRVPGRPGHLLLSADVEPLELKARLFLDAPSALTTAQRAEVRKTLRLWLLSTDGAALKVPGEPDLEWRDVLCTGVSGWSSLFADGSATVTFLAFDPIAYGTRLVSAMGAFKFTGNQPTWPTFALTVSSGVTEAGVTDGKSGRSLIVERAFVSGDRLSFDCARQTVTVNGKDAAADLTLRSDFFQLEPRYTDLSFPGCTKYNTWFYERWA